jgi:hypothetical protein
MALAAEARLEILADKAAFLARAKLGHRGRAA